MKTIHIYGQYDGHDTVAIVGNKEALLLLKETIEKALAENIATADVFTNDGEGYDLVIIPQENMIEMIVPYTSNSYEGCDGKRFWSLIEFNRDTLKWERK